MPLRRVSFGRPEAEPHDGTSRAPGYLGLVEIGEVVQMQERRDAAAEVATSGLHLIEMEHVRLRRQPADALAELALAQIGDGPPHELRPSLQAILRRHRDELDRDAWSDSLRAPGETRGNRREFDTFVRVEALQQSGRTTACRTPLQVGRRRVRQQ